MRKIAEHKAIHGCGVLWFENFKILGVYGRHGFNCMEWGACEMEIKDSDIFDDYEEPFDYIDEEWWDKECEKQYKKEWDEKHNIHRDKRGRLNKGALLASKDSCNEYGILLRLASGMTVNEITECMGCSKSTVYHVRKKHREQNRKSAILENPTTS